MLPQKLQIIPDNLEFTALEKSPLIFWKKISRLSNAEMDLFLMVEARTNKETETLGRELWEALSAYENELIINQNGLNNPEFVCESLLKLGNDFLVKWSQKTQIENWNELGLLLSVANQSSMFFTRIGAPRIVLFRNNQLVLADENLSHPRSPQFSSPFLELAGGPLLPGDRILVLSSPITESFSWEEISSLAVPSELTRAYYNLVRSIEVVNPQKNCSFLLGEIVSANKEDDEIKNILNNKLRENRLGDLLFKEYNPTLKPVVPVSKSSVLPWKNISSTIGKTIGGLVSFIFKIIRIPLSPLSAKISSLSSTRKFILFSALAVFLAFVFLLSRSLINPPNQGLTPQKDYKQLFDEANRLKEEASSALIYQDEEKARKSLAQAEELLTEASQSSEWGIKAMKLKEEISDQLSTLDKAQPSQATKIWSVPENQGNATNLVLSNNGVITLISTKNVWNIKPENDSAESSSFNQNISLDQGKDWLLPVGSNLLCVAPQNGFFYLINPNSKNVSDKNSLPSDIKSEFSAASSFGNTVYFYDQSSTQIKQFSYDGSNLAFKADWLKQDMKEDFPQSDQPISMSIDGSIFIVTQKGNLLKLSGGKKASWNVEKPGSTIEGGNLALKTKPEDKNLYLLDPSKKRIVIFEKENGKLVGQIQNTNLAKAIDFDVDESKKVIYFTTLTDLFKSAFESQ